MKSTRAYHYVHGREGTVCFSSFSLVCSADGKGLARQRDKVYDIELNHTSREIHSCITGHPLFEVDVQAVHGMCPQMHPVNLSHTH